MSDLINLRGELDRMTGHRALLIKADGDAIPFDHVLGIRGVEVLIGAAGLDTINLRDGRVMFVDDLGFDKDKPVNLQATEIYHSVCRPGTTWQIRGDVIVVHDRDYLHRRRRRLIERTPR